MTIQLIALKDLVLNEKISFFRKTPMQNIEWIEESIENEGLLNPLIVTRRNNKFVVLDGKKRLTAIRKLARSHDYRRALHKIPCLVDVPESVIRKLNQPALISQPELAHKALIALRAGASAKAISQRFDCSLCVIEDIMMLPNLHPDIMKHFNSKTISLQQAAAFATIDNPKAQWALLLELGPFVSRTEIISAIRSGEVVLDLPNGETIILPSRRAARKTPNFDSRKAARSHEPLAA